MSLEINKIYNGDCLELMPEIDDESIDLILCDLPYGTTKCKWDNIIDFDLLWKQYKRIIKPNGAILLFGAEPFSSKLRLSNLDMFRYDWYWEKDKGSNFIFGNIQPLRVVETISVFYKHQPIYNPQKINNPKGIDKRYLGKRCENSGLAMEVNPAMPKIVEYGKNYEPDKLLPRQLIYFAKQQRNLLHPTQKPIPLLEYLIKTYTNPNQLVLDNYAGSGSTGVACFNTNRKYILIEKDEKYYNIIKERMKGLVRQVSFDEILS